ncbi:MAG: cob(I)yrinic acid a,c-diamide adenosyltransferase [bacterium]|nr:cob(I)yrinic acid a,c-diamide adenosyltransferase [bacterium]MBU1916796.1 cob(I)yrinic acid a,c-diamide adenosyltransferase [bacterium]
MKIYTKTGDDGTTGLCDGSRVEKDHLRVDSYGDVDELNSTLGLAASHTDDKTLKEQLVTIQKDLMSLGSLLSKGQKDKIDLSEKHIQALETFIDQHEEKLPPLKNFILPGGSKLASILHMARTTCRRAERKCVTLAKKDVVDPLCVMYLNRLSDYLFVASRYANVLNQVEDVVW